MSHAGIFFTMAAVLTFEAILLRLASEPEGGREVKARKGESHLGAFIRENWYWLLLLFCALGALCCAILRSCMIMVKVTISYQSVKEGFAIATRRNKLLACNRTETIERTC